MTDRQQIAADWAARGFSCDLWTDPPGQRWEDFTHATDEVVIVLEGEMECRRRSPSPATGQGTVDPSRRGSLGTEHRQHNSPIVIRLPPRLELF